MKKIIHEIHRRSLWQVLGIYLAGSWVALQVVEQLAEAASLPEWIRPLALILLVIGLPVVLATAFVQEGMSAKSTKSALQTLADIGEIPPPPAAPGGASALFTWKNAVMGGIGALTVWGLVALVWVLRGGGQATASDDALPGAPSSLQARVAAIAARANADLPAVAVLPFEDSGSDDDYAFFADGVHEDLLTNLAKVNGLIVLARPTVMPYRGSDLSIVEIAEALGANAIVTGSVRRVGTDVRISVQLTDPATSASVWAERYDRSLEDIFAVQSEIALAVANALRTELSPEEAARLAAVPTGDLTAFDLYTRGRQAYYEYEPDANDRAIQLFRQAIAKDPAYGQAWAGLADAIAQRVARWGAAIEWADSAAAAGARAVELVPESSEAHKAFALSMAQLGRVEQSMAANERALELNPNNADAANNLALVYGTLGRQSDAIPLYELSERLRPHVFARTNMGISYALMGFPDRARELAALDQEFSGVNQSNLNVQALSATFEGDGATAAALDGRRVEVAPDDPRVWADVASRALLRGDLDRAVEWASVALGSESEGEHFVRNAHTTLGQVALARGDTTTARRHLRQSLAQLQGWQDVGSDDSWTHSQLAVVHAALGDRERALEEAALAVERGMNLAWLWEREPAFVALREDPRFIEIVGRARRSWDEERRKIAEREGLAVPPTPRTGP